MRKRLWTSTHRWMGNLLPAIVWLPLTGLGVYFMLRTGDPLGVGFWIILLAQGVGWILLNFLGLYDNRRLKRLMLKEYEADHPEDQRRKAFVGFASPKHHSMLDAHEDVGYLVFDDQSLDFYGDVKKIRLLRQDIRSVRFRPNVHTLVGLGRWIAVDGMVDHKPVRFLIEPRESSVMLINLFASSGLKRRILLWKNGVSPEPKARG